MIPSLRGAEGDAAIHLRQLDCFATLAMTEDGRSLLRAFARNSLLGPTSLPGRYEGVADKVIKPQPKPAAAQAAKAAKTLAESGKQVERSTAKVRVEAQKVTAETRRQVQLAADRTLLATERTYAAWVRTALASLASGVGARALLQDYLPLWLAKTTASVLIVFAGFCVVAAVWRHLFEAVPPPATDIRRVPRMALLPMNAFLLLVAVAALVGIWVG